MAIRTAVAIRNAMLDVLGGQADNGFVRAYGGSVPATADTALSGQPQLAELTLGADAFPAASGGVLTANAIGQDVAADATGTATFYRVYKSDGTTVLWQGSVGTSGADLTFDNVDFQVGANVTIESFSYALPA